MLSEECWGASERVFAAITQHPFLAELAAGTLAHDRFAFYAQQDSLYLKDFARALALVAAKAPDNETAKTLLGYAKDGVEVELALHRHFFKVFRVQPTHEKGPACFAYTAHLLAVTSLEPYAVGVAAVLPCFWVYREVGLMVAAKSAPGNPYQAWIDTYADPAFAEATQRMIHFFDRAAQRADDDQRVRMKEVFAQSTLCEWWFWDSAYRMERLCALPGQPGGG